MMSVPGFMFLLTIGFGFGAAIGAAFVEDKALRFIAVGMVVIAGGAVLYHGGGVGAKGTVLSISDGDDALYDNITIWAAPDDDRLVLKQGEERDRTFRTIDLPVVGGADAIRAADAEGCVRFLPAPNRQGDDALKAVAVACPDAS